MAASFLAGVRASKDLYSTVCPGINRKVWHYKKRQDSNHSSRREPRNSPVTLTWRGYHSHRVLLLFPVTRMPAARNSHTPSCSMRKMTTPKKDIFDVFEKSSGMSAKSPQVSKLFSRSPACAFRLRGGFAGKMGNYPPPPSARRRNCSRMRFEGRGCG